MGRLYTANDTAHAMRVLRALLPQGVTAAATVAEKGWELRIVVCGKTECRTYKFNTGIEDRHLLRIAGWWETGVEVPSDAPVIEARSAPALKSSDEMRLWLASARPGQRAVYFRGDLTQWRHDTSKRLVALQAIVDSARSEYERKARERAELQSIQDTRDLLDAVDTAQRRAIVSLVQERLSDGAGAVYYAVRR